MGWFNELGARRTPEDPDGSKHRLGFLAFVVAMLVLIAVLIVIQANRADAATKCRGPVSGIYPEAAGFADHSVTLKTNSWCYAGKRFTTAPTFGRSYTEGPWVFTKWFDTKTQTGVATAPNGQAGVQYKTQWVAAEFKLCVGVGPAQLCEHSKPYSVRIWAWANGNYTVKAQRGSLPNLPMPRP